jgi:anti-sigma28 factor (negative regulator of flagellin synthesis)
MKPKSTKKSAKAAASVSMQGALPKLSLTMPLDKQKISAIQRCIAKGTLKITVSKVDFAAGKIGEAWLYD